MDSKYFVYYFPFRASGETIRLILSYINVEWDNYIIKNWKEEKFRTKGLIFHQVPMLIELTKSGTEFRLVQTNAIIKYLTDKFGLASNNIYKNALLQSYYEGLNEIKVKILKKLFSIKFENEKLSKLVKELRKENSFLSQFLVENENILYTNHGGNGYYMDNKITYVDIEALDFVDCINDIPGLNHFINRKNAPNLMKVYDHVHRHPNISAYKRSDKRLFHHLLQSSL